MQPDPLSTIGAQIRPKQVGTRSIPATSGRTLDETKEISPATNAALMLTSIGMTRAELP